MKRREVIKGLGALSAAGLMAFKSDLLFADADFDRFELNGYDKSTSYKGGEELRLGIIGFGIRGEQLVRAAGFATEATEAMSALSVLPGSVTFAESPGRTRSMTDS